MNDKRVENIEALEINLHSQRVGILVSYQGGRNMLSFDPAYVDGYQTNMTYSLRQLICSTWNKPHINQQRLSPVLSNLLPEGALRLPDKLRPANFLIDSISYKASSIAGSLRL